MGGETLPIMQTDSGNTEERRTSLLDELQKEIDRLRLLSPTGQSNSINFILIYLYLLVNKRHAPE